MSYFFSILQSVNSNVNSESEFTKYKDTFPISLKKKYIEPRIYHGGDNFDLSKRWFVYYSYEHPTLKNKDGSPKMVRQSHIMYGANRKFKTVRERLKYLEWLRDVIHELLKQGHSPYDRKKFFNEESLNYTAEAALDYALEYRTKKVSATTLPDYKSKHKLFKEYLEKKGLLKRNILDVTKRHVNLYLNGISNSRSSNNHKTVLSSFFGVLEKDEIIPRNFIKDIDDLKTNSVVHKTYPISILEELFKFMIENDPLLFLFVKVVAYNFLRPIEVCRLRLKDLIIPEKYLYVKAKNKPTKRKLIPDLVVSELLNLDYSKQNALLFTPGGMGKSWLVKGKNGKEVQETSRREYFTKRYGRLKTKFNEYLIEQNINYQLTDDHTMYSFRHTIITILFSEFRKKYTITETYDKLMLVTGHSTLKALKEYLRDIDAELAEDYSGMLVQSLPKFK
ncbi:tyrosine-type recombinase/integrase [Hyunsoonleella pacifica]|uniref:Core-binding (CB) domain-containing protein n=1 Tax=Hyunsoonleella pacifica TaxID=1080224 RepID=A0A4Q9FKJ2_9FLAO|nr:hypothetical protein [Hyunsoonleella pacifica]TBN14425.1 hypothetical protein EYD46_12690 [Hyunsoonleella pacifica]GGD13666.1 hypothetical protein GCM10011368_14530 [Hyunsoonleella pacifica]